MDLSQHSEGVSYALLNPRTGKYLWEGWGRVNLVKEPHRSTLFANEDHARRIARMAHYVGGRLAPELEFKAVAVKVTYELVKDRP